MVEIIDRGNSRLSRRIEERDESIYDDGEDGGYDESRYDNMSDYHNHQSVNVKITPAGHGSA